MKKILIINGPNLNLLGLREVEVYGAKTLAEIEKLTREMLAGEKLSVHLDWVQFNGEGQIVDKIHEVFTTASHDGLVINPGAFSHTSIAILDALKILKIPIVEVHLSHTLKREGFRQNKITAFASIGVIEGFGEWVYYLGIKALCL